MDSRNIIDYYKYWETEAILADLDTKRNNFGVLTVNVHGDFNIGTIIRNANAFLAKEVLVYGKRNFDRRGCVGTQNYTRFKHVRDVSELPDVPIVAIDNVDMATAIEQYSFPTTYFLMAFGEESVGLPKEIIDRAIARVYIRQYGSVRSLNVGSASAIMMHEYCRRI